MADVARMLKVMGRGNPKGKPRSTFSLPADHKPGMKVPKGGSMCSNCEYLKDREKGLCGSDGFIAWNGSDKIPGKIDEYCSDWFDWKGK